MSLDDIVKAGKEDFEVINLLQQFEKKPTMNLAAALKELGDDGKRAVETYGEENFLSSTPAQLMEYLGRVSSKRQDRLVSRVTENMGEVVFALDDYTGMLLSVKPVEGVDENIKKKHKRAQKYATNPQEAYKNFVSETEESDNDFLSAGLILLEMRPELAEAVAKREVHNAVEDFRASLGEKENAMNYIMSIYEKSDDKRKKQLVYALGAGFYQEQLKKDKKKE